MAQLSNRDDNFISTLLSVSGRVRPTDLHAVGAAEAAELLRAYHAAHPEMALGFDGDTLAMGATAAPPAPMPAPQPTFEPTFEAAPAPLYAEPLAPAEAPPAVVESGGEALPSWVYESPSEAPAADLSEIPAPMPAAPTETESQFAGDFEPLPDYAAPMFADEPVAKIAWYWWVITVLLWPIGGLVAFLVVKGSNPKGSGKLLILTGVIFLVWVAIIAALFFFGFLGTMRALVP